MIQQTGTALVFEFWFTASKQGKTGLADVIVDVYDHTRTKIVTAAAATEVGGGLYTYTLASGSNTGAGNYRAVAKTADATVDFQHVPSLWTVGEGWVQNVDAAVSSRSTFAGGAVASVTGNVGGNVGGIAGVTFPANFGALVIDGTNGQVRANVQYVNQVHITGAGTSGSPFVPG